ncbi:MAG: methyltransferase domain-containing protein [Synechococcales cyanobacterium C42_A2020_086]|jgi:ubiquinone/menaquinone biosynthesis C-methylase UbiE|nr:methyltransferase domain-containing protein [Synechococcales cyanobacterium C42_A2020_086]
MESYEVLNEAQEFSETDPFTLERYKQFFSHFSKPGMAVLDVGCNTGRGGRLLKSLDPSVHLIGLDCVKGRLDRIEVGIYQSKLCSYSTDISLNDSSVDAIVAGEFIEHLYLKDVEQSLREFYRVLKAGGRLQLTTPNPGYIRLKLTRGSVLGGAHVSQHEPIELKRRLEQIGFTNIRICGSGKMTRILGESFFPLALYGSYLVIADK